MGSDNSYWMKYTRGRVRRRQFLKGLGATSAGVVALSLVGCGDDDDDSGGGGDTGGGGGGGASSSPTTGGSPSTGGGGASGGPKSGGVLRASLGANAPVSLDMHQQIFYYSLWPPTMMYNQLLKFDQYEAEKIVSDLASSWETPEDTKIVLNLFEASFHDGTPMTSADVKASIERLKNPPEGVSSPRQGQFNVLDSVETPDDRTVVLNMARPSASFFGTLAHMNAAIFSAKDMADISFHEQNVNGTGPFMLERVDAGTLVVLARNPNYFREGLPYLDGWEWHIIPEAVAAQAAFETEELDMFGPNTAQVEELSGKAGVTVVQAPGTTWWASTIATQKEPWNDDRVWKAVALAINKQDFNQVNYQGAAEIGAPLPPSSKWSLTEQELLMVPGYKGLGDGQESDMEARWAESRKLLDAVGIAEGTPVKVHSWDRFENWALVFGDGLEHVGLEPELNLVELGLYNERLAARDFGDMAANSRTAVFPDPTPVFADSYIEGAGRHYTDLIIPEVEDLFVKQDAELDEEKRFDLQHRMQTAYLEIYPAEIACFTVTRQAFQDYVKDYGVQYGGLFQGRKNEEIWLDKA